MQSPDVEHTLTDASPWVQERTPITITAEDVSIGDVKVKFATSTTTAILAAYIDLINEVRAEPMLDVFLARETDVRALARSLDTSPEEIITKLRHLLRQPVEYRAWA